MTTEYWLRYEGQNVNARRYVLHPGLVETGKGTHYFSARALITAYGVPVDAVVLIVYKENNHLYSERPGDVHLYPRADGKYEKVTMEKGK